MANHTRQDEVALWQMYIWSGIQAIAEFPEADGVEILRTASGKEYRFPMTLGNYAGEMERLVKTLAEDGETQISYLCHVWKNHGLDLPGAALRDGLIQLNPGNQNTLTMVCGEENFILRSLEELSRGI